MIEETLMLSSREIEKQIENYKLDFPQVRDERIEWNTKLPMFVATFNKLIQEKGVVPSQDNFVKRYFEDNSAELSSVISSESLKAGLEARARRAYPSFVRDIHLDALLRERGLQVSYDQETDIVGGVDHKITYKGETFHVHGYVGTNRGRFGRKVKNRRHKFLGVHIDMALDLSAKTTKKVGNFLLYSEEDIDNLVKQIDKKAK
jgi:hypothetical protein